MKLNIKTSIQYEDQLPGAEFPRNMARGGLSDPITRQLLGAPFGAAGRAISASHLVSSTSRAITLSAGWNGAARIPCRKSRVSTAGKPGSCGGPFLAAACRMSVHTAIFDWVLALIADGGSGQGRAHRGRLPRPWRPTRRCATSCGGTRARDDAGALGPGERHRDTHGRGPGALGPQALEASNQDVSKSDFRPRSHR